MSLDGVNERFRQRNAADCGGNNSAAGPKEMGIWNEGGEEPRCAECQEECQEATLGGNSSGLGEGLRTQKESEEVEGCEDEDDYGDGGDNCACAEDVWDR